MSEPDQIEIERRRFQQIVDALVDGAVAHDEERRIFLFNRAAEQITGRSRDDVVGRDCHEVFGGEGICGGECRFRDGAPDPITPAKYEISLITADGEDRRVEVRAHPLAPRADGQRAVFAQLRDVSELQGLRARVQQRRSLEGMVAVSTPMREVFETIEQVATSDYPVLVFGETGTGKELAANAIHRRSRRKGGPFVPINCGALPENILESELFGHVRGAFTGAIRDKKGRFELANRGTLFLDEVGELTPAFQVKLLRALQEKRFERVGGERTVSVDVRIVAATNRDLRVMVRDGAFRQDLFYRLCVVPLTMPPLRSRAEDIPLLVEQMMEQIREESGKEISGVSARAMSLLMGYRWPGNVRELINALQFASVRCADTVISAGHLPPEIQQLSQPRRVPLGAPHPELATTPRQRTKLDRAMVEAALAQTGGNKVQAARVLGVGRATLYRFLKLHPIS
jgi:sigma-54 dependent transcriptional regulator, acetoin dehydrogenase operon transcriptional activator AcoR